MTVGKTSIGSIKHNQWLYVMVTSNVSVTYVECFAVLQCIMGHKTMNIPNGIILWSHTTTLYIKFYLMLVSNGAIRNRMGLSRAI